MGGALAFRAEALFECIDMDTVLEFRAFDHGGGEFGDGHGVHLLDVFGPQFRVEIGQFTAFVAEFALDFGHGDLAGLRHTGENPRREPGEGIVLKWIPARICEDDSDDFSWRGEVGRSDREG